MSHDDRSAVYRPFLRSGMYRSWIPGDRMLGRKLAPGLVVAALTLGSGTAGYWLTFWFAPDARDRTEHIEAVPLGRRPLAASSVAGPEPVIAVTPEPPVSGAATASGAPARKSARVVAIANANHAGMLLTAVRPQARVGFVATRAQPAAPSTAADGVAPSAELVAAEPVLQPAAAGVATPQPSAAAHSPPPSAAGMVTPQSSAAVHSLPPSAAAEPASRVITTRMTIPPVAPTKSSKATLSASPALQRIALRGAMSASRLRRAMDRVRPALVACYEHSARQAGRNQFGNVRVDVVIDEVGRVRNPRVSGGALPGLDDCLTAVAAKLVTEPPDTGIVTAMLVVSFAP